MEYNRTARLNYAIIHSGYYHQYLNNVIQSNIYTFLPFCTKLHSVDDLREDDRG